MSAAAFPLIDFNPNFTFNAHSTAATRNLEDNIDPVTVMDKNKDDDKDGKRAVPFTVASVLPKCNYKEPENPKEPRTDAYNSVQIQILEYLNAHAADELTVAQAHFFLENAGTKPHGPTAKQAVELCYYMRSHGFDVYTKLAPKENKIRLYVADRDSKNRDHDELFWDQNIKTGEIASLTQIAATNAPVQPASMRRGRRGAVPDITAFGTL